MPVFKWNRNLQLCAICGKNPLEDGITLRQCKGCGIQVYCGKECQVADWPQHKTLCQSRKVTVARLATIPLAARALEDMDALHTWTSVHMLAFQHIAAQELAIFDDPARGAHVLFAVAVQARAGEPADSWKRFRIVDAAPHPVLALAAPNARRARTSYDNANAKHRERGYGTYLIAFILCYEPAEGLRIPVAQFTPVAFKLGMSGASYRAPADVVDMINSGKVFKPERVPRIRC